MQAVVYDHFGDESVLAVREVSAPQPGRGQVQVRVRFASLNPVDFKLRAGLLRLIGRPRRPAITGKDFAGEISALGPGVQGYRVGQRVFGSVDPMGSQGACAQLVAVSTEVLASTPEAVSDEVASCLPVASGTALQALEDIARLRRGQSVLVTGASGGVGSSGVQLARSIGARVTGVCGSESVDYVRSIGAATVIDYKAQDWREIEERFDVIFDAAAIADFSSARPLLDSRGIYINTFPGPGLYVAAVLARLTSRQRCVAFMLRTHAAQLERLARLAGDRVIAPRIHEVVGLEQVGDAQRRMAGGKVQGKVCVRIPA